MFLPFPVKPLLGVVVGLSGTHLEKIGKKG
jgi:hypothetical protein